MTASASPIVITGANGVFAALACRALAAEGRHLICTVRDPAKIRASPGVLPTEGSTVEYAQLELSDLDSVRSFARSLKPRIESGRLARIGALVCSAAMQKIKDTPQLTTAGYETTFAVNHVAHFLLIAEVLPLMAPDGVVIVVGSDAHRTDYPFFVNKPGYKPLSEVIKPGAPGSDGSAKARDLGLQRCADPDIGQACPLISSDGSSKLYQVPAQSRANVLLIMADDNGT